jgi:hypothetical protein
VGFYGFFVEKAIKTPIIGHACGGAAWQFV